MSRNRVIREVKLTRKKLYCECRDDIYVGIPCRHILATVSKDNSLNFENLNLEKRWRFDFFKDIENIKEPDLLNDIEKENEEEKLENETDKNEIISEISMVYLFNSLQRLIYLD